MDKKIPVKTLYMLSLISFGLIALGLGSTYAIFTASAEINNPISIVSNLAYNSDVIETADVIVPAGEIVSTSLNISNTSSNLLNYITWYSTSSSDIYAGVKISSGSSNPTGTITSNAEPIQVIVQLKNASTSSKLVTIGISGSTDSVVKDSLMTEVPNREIYYLTDYVNNLYTNNSKSSVTNNNISYNYINLYDTDTDDTTSGGLINDRLGSDSIDVNSGNIRYYGANPNNYVDIGDVYEEDMVLNNWEQLSAYGIPVTDSASCHNYFDCEASVEAGKYSTIEECNIENNNLIANFGFSSITEACAGVVTAGTPKSLYRIIGLFKNIELEDESTEDLIKVVKKDTIGELVWDFSPENVNGGNGINEWSQADLMKLLNPGYSANQDLDPNGNTVLINNSLWWNRKAGICFIGPYSTAGRDFTGSGLSDNVKRKIETVNWNLGTGTSKYANQIYTEERGTNVYQDAQDGVIRTTKWQGKVAIEYVSDYLYATDFTKCRESSDMFGGYCSDNDWLYYFSKHFLNTISSVGIYQIRVDMVADTTANTAGWVFPSFYLNANTALISGDGTESNPYVIR